MSWFKKKIKKEESQIGVSHEIIILRILKSVGEQIDVLIKSRGLSSADDYFEELREKADESIKKVLPVINSYSKKNKNFWEDEIEIPLKRAFGKEVSLENKKVFVDEAISNLSRVVNSKRKKAA